MEPAFRRDQFIEFDGTNIEEILTVINTNIPDQQRQWFLVEGTTDTIENGEYHDQYQMQPGDRANESGWTAAEQFAKQYVTLAQLQALLNPPA